MDIPARSPVRLSISCVSYALDAPVLIATLESLVQACVFAKQSGLLTEVQLFLIDNGPDQNNKNALQEIQETFARQFDRITLLSGHGNLGYGRGNNLALLQTDCDYHLVLNPDVLLARDNLHIALAYMQQQTDVALLAPDGVGEQGERQFLAKRHPSFLVLLARATRHPWLCKKIKTQMDAYEYRDLIPAAQPLDIELASGCYMLLRTPMARQVGGFDPAFFMYFEDFDLSRRIARVGRVRHHPAVKIIHFGGEAAKKGGGHTRLFLTSYIKFLIKYFLK
jgi:hypothetical protein